VVCCFILGELGNEIKALSFFPRFQYDLEVAKQVMPVSVIFVAMITFNKCAAPPLSCRAARRARCSVI